MKPRTAKTDTARRAAKVSHIASARDRRKPPELKPEISGEAPGISIVMPDLLRADVERAAALSGHSVEQEVLAALRDRYASPAEPIQLELNFSEIDRKARVIETARRLYGKRQAKRLWSLLGLPDLSGRSPAPPNAALLRSVEEFITARLSRVSDRTIPAADVYGAYCAWARQKHQPFLTVTMFGRLMNHTAIRKRRGRRVTYEATWR